MLTLKFNNFAIFCKGEKFFLRIISVLDNDLGPEGGNENMFKEFNCCQVNVYILLAVTLFAITLGGQIKCQFSSRGKVQLKHQSENII